MFTSHLLWQQTSFFVNIWITTPRPEASGTCILAEGTRMHRYRRTRIYITLHLLTLLDLNAISRVLTRLYVFFKCIATFSSTTLLVFQQFKVSL